MCIDLAFKGASYEERRIMEPERNKAITSGGLFVDLIPVPAAILDGEKRIVLANSTLSELLGRDRSALSGRELKGLFEGATEELDEHASRGPEETSYTLRVSLAGKGYTCHVEKLDEDAASTIAGLDADQGTAPHFLCLLCREQLSDTALRQVDLLDLVEHANDLIQCVGPDGSILYVNRAWKETLGYSDDDIKGLKFWDLISSECMEHCQQMYSMLLEGKALSRFETAFIAKDGRTVYLEGSVNGRFENGRLVNTRGIFRDITEKKRAEEEARRLQERLIASQRYESLGILAGGIAHDFNNILMAILGFSELIKLKGQGNLEILKYVDRIEGSARRAADLTGQMLAFSGLSLLSKEEVELSELIRDAGPIIEATASKKIRFEYRIDPGDLRVEADRNQLLQALVNIITNAAEAIGDKRGTITIEAGRIEADGALFQNTIGGDEAVPGTYCFIKVSDTGCGMAPDVEDKAFDPFFSTKFTGRGLGLPATLGIVKGHQGALELETAQGQGTTVTIYLPVFGTDSLARLVKEQAIKLQERRPLVLVIDDEVLVRELLENYLEDLNFRTIFAANGREGLELFVRRKDEIDLVILDLLMPEIDGFELLRHIRGLNSRVPIMVISGYEKRNVIGKIPEGHMSAFLRKPFSRSDLEEAISSIFGVEPGSLSRDGG